MALSIRPRHTKRYKDIALLLVKYGRRDLASDLGLTGHVDHDETTAASADDLVADLERLGPTYVKLGQVLSTRADLLPQPYVEALARLQDDVAPFDFDEVERTISTELGVRLSRVFPEFSPTPIASASLGQVHEARLRDGRRVAVKVQRPGARVQVLDDLDALRELAEFADTHTAFGRRIGFADMVAEFRRTLLAELDYLQEANNLMVFGEEIAEFPRLRVPQPLMDLSTSRVLTMEYVPGRKLTTLSPLAKLELDGSELATELLAAYLKQILIDGFFHADPHPGNVLLTDDGDLALLDLGMVGRIRPELADTLVKLLLALSEGRGAEAAHTLLALVEDTGAADEGAFTREIVGIVGDIGAVRTGRVSVGAMIMEISRAAIAAGLHAPPELSMLGRALLTLDDVLRALDPDLDPNAAVKAQAARIMTRRMSSSTSQGSVFSTMLEAKEFAEKLPGRVNRVMDALAEGALTLNVKGIDQREIIHGIHKLANRLTTGLVIAALIIGAAMLMRVPTHARILGYPALAIICFLVAAAFGILLLVSIYAGDRRRPKGR